MSWLLEEPVAMPTAAADDGRHSSRWLHGLRGGRSVCPRPHLQLAGGAAQQGREHLAGHEVGGEDGGAGHHVVGEHVGQQVLQEGGGGRNEPSVTEASQKRSRHARRAADWRGQQGQAGGRKRWATAVQGQGRG